jgi:hypothetical protein
MFGVSECGHLLVGIEIGAIAMKKEVFDKRSNQLH